MIEAQFREERRKGVGGSDAGAILGCDPYRCPADVWLEKMDLAEPFAGNVSTETGNWNEEFIARMFMAETGLRVQEVQEMAACIERETGGFPAIAHVDRITMSPEELGILECKFAWRKVKDGRPYPHWIAQVEHYLYVTGWQKGYIACLNGGSFDVWPVVRNEERIAHLVEAERTFWNDYVLTGIPPLEGATTDVLKLLYPLDTGEVLTLDDEAAQLAADYRHWTGVETSAAKTKGIIGARLQAHMKDASEAQAGDYRITWKAQTRKAFNVAEKTTRVLRVTGGDDD
jgi:putative phage-type endonuclease